ncbi:hypothetical protein DBZ36_14320 [Alginatibacterium sediminis]|uniref:Porin n=1 Tax=Alginatibacterium sediminis TaxID=2164068 RepID=A0A420E856_9ALTE|nr:hypothetical protein [Alginatibacterium sediminis]RKF15560.1 hypothetical protein DBZ36_14320 [Alginatibacterium sediminis]
MTMSTRFRFFLSLIALLSASSSWADVQAPTWGGFLSAGYIAPSDNNFYGFESGDSGPIYEAGLHGRWALSPRLSVSGLLSARDTGDWFENGLVVDHLSLNANLWSNQNWDLHAKLGRIKLKNGLYGTTRDVPFTKPSIILPQSIYPHILREQSLRSDGLSLDFYRNFGFEKELNINLTYGKEPYDPNMSKRFLGSQQEGTFESEVNLSAFVSYRPNSTWFMAFQAREYAMTLEQALPGYDYVFDVRQYLASLQYSQQRFEISSELSFRDGGTYGKPDLAVFTGSVDMWSGYVNAIYYLRPTVELWARYDHSQFIPDYIPDKYKRLQDIAIGTTWNFHSQWQLKAEYHWFKGVSMIPPIRDLYGPDGNPKMYWQMAAVQLSFRF